MSKSNRLSDVDPRLQGREIKYGGRTLVIQVVLNTDEDFADVIKRIESAAKGPGQKMVLLTSAEADPEQAKAFWGIVFIKAEETVKKEKEAELCSPENKY